MAAESRDRWRHHFFSSVDYFIPRWPSKSFILIRYDVLHLQLWRHNEGTFDIIKKSHLFPIRSTCRVPTFNFFRYRGPKFFRFPIWLPRHVTFDIIIMIETFYMSSRTNDENIVSIRQAVAEKNTNVLGGQTDRQTDNQTDTNVIPPPSARVTRRALSRVDTSTMQCLIQKNISRPIHFWDMPYIILASSLNGEESLKIPVVRSGSSPKSNQLVLVTHRTCPQNFIRIHPQLFEISCTQTNKWNCSLSKELPE